MLRRADFTSAIDHLQHVLDNKPGKLGGKLVKLRKQLVVNLINSIQIFILHWYVLWMLQEELLIWKFVKNIYKKVNNQQFILIMLELIIVMVYTNGIDCPF